MKNIGIVPMEGNPSTARLIIPGVRNDVKPFGTESIQLSIPFREDKYELYCNSCEFLSRVPRPGQQTCNCRCTADTSIPGGKVIKLKVYPEEKIKKQFWCPKIKDKILGNDSLSSSKSAMSDEQLKAWNKSKEERIAKEKWLSLPGITSWGDIKIGKVYHMPPMLKRGRMNLYIAVKYCDSLMAYKNGTNERVWIYKQDEDYKFLSEMK